MRSADAGPGCIRSPPHSPYRARIRPAWKSLRRSDLAERKTAPGLLSWTCPPLGCCRRGDEIDRVGEDEYYKVHPPYIPEYSDEDDSIIVENDYEEYDYDA